MTITTEEAERMAAALLDRSYDPQEKITHILRRLHVDRLNASKMIRAIAAERDALRKERDEARDEHRFALLMMDQAGKETDALVALFNAADKTAVPIVDDSGAFVSIDGKAWVKLEAAMRRAAATEGGE